jgi:hypothetical protein
MVGTLLSTSFDAGVCRCREQYSPAADNVQEAASHADPRTTRRTTKAGAH